MKSNIPVIDHELPNYKDVLAREITHLHHDLDSKVKKSQTIQWVKTNLSTNVKSLIDLPDYEFESIGKYAYILNNGAKLDEKLKESYNKHISMLCNKIALAPVTDIVDSNKPTIQDYIKDKANNTIQLFDSWIDMFTKAPESYNFDVKKIKHNMELLKPAHHKHIAEYYRSVYDEISLVLDGDDGLYEGYDHFTKTQLRKLHAFYKLVFDSMVIVAESQPKRQVDIFKALAKLKYKVLDGEIKSINPKLILGAKELWIFNTKTNKLGVYISDNALSVSGSNIIGYNTNSVEKMVKLKEFDLKQFQLGNQAFKQNQFKAVKAIDIKLNGKITDQHLILATY